MQHYICLYKFNVMELKHHSRLFCVQQLKPWKTLIARNWGRRSDRRCAVWAQTFRSCADSTSKMSNHWLVTRKMYFYSWCFYQANGSFDTCIFTFCPCREELQSIHRELEVLSEQYSQKCLENAHLAQALEAERQALGQCQRENQKLHIHNQVNMNFFQEEQLDKENKMSFFYSNINNN